MPNKSANSPENPSHLPKAAFHLPASIFANMKGYTCSRFKAFFSSLLGVYHL